MVYIIALLLIVLFFIRADLIDYYQRLGKEAEKRMERAKWRARRFAQATARIQQGLDLEDEEVLEGGNAHIVNGSQDIVNGFQDIVNGSQDIVNGSQDIVNGSQDIVNGSQDIVNGSQDIVNGSQDIVGGSQNIVSLGLVLLVYLILPQFLQMLLLQ